MLERLCEDRLLRDGKSVRYSASRGKLGDRPSAKENITTGAGDVQLRGPCRLKRSRRNVGKEG